MTTLYYLGKVADPKSEREGALSAFTTLLDIVEHTHYRRAAGWQELCGIASEKWLSIGQVEIEMGVDGQIRVERLKSQLSLDIFEAVRETGFIPVVRSDGE
jgi:acetolactate synthase regulatory subunit